MPRWLRQFTFNQINEFYKKESEEYEKASSKGGPNTSTLVDPSGNVDRNAWKSVTSGPKTTPNSKVKYK